jgi:hypothetical protein
MTAPCAHLCFGARFRFRDGRTRGPQARGGASDKGFVDFDNFKAKRKEKGGTEVFFPSWFFYYFWGSSRFGFGGMHTSKKHGPHGPSATNRRINIYVNVSARLPFGGSLLGTRGDLHLDPVYDGHLLHYLP